MEIRSAETISLSDILNVHIEAFGKNIGAVTSTLVDDLLEDETAKPVYSFAAVVNENVIGHILFTRVTVLGTGEGLSAQILAP